MLVLALLLPFSGQTAQKQMLHGHVPAAAATARRVGRLPGSDRLDIAIGLPLRNQQQLKDFLHELYDPASPNYRHYLTPKQFADKFGPSAADYQALKGFARTHGLVLKRTHANRALLVVDGSVSAIERAFGIHMLTYRHPSEDRNFYAPDQEPVLDLGVKVLAISGLDNYELPHPMNLRPSAAGRLENAQPCTGSGPGGGYMGSDFRTAYVPGVALDGAGQTVGLLEFDGYYANDIRAYEAQAGLPNVPLRNVLLDGYTGAPSFNNAEVALDIEMAISMAPGLAQVIVYEAGPYGIAADMLNRMATDNQAKQISSSWGWRPYDPNSEQVYQQFAAQGQSFFNASGDSDAYVGPLPWSPMDDPYITIVGGTTLTTTSAGGSWMAEKVWNWGGGIGSSGGISTTYTIPSWQQGIDMSGNQGSMTMRNIPDVSMTADNVWVKYNNGGSGTFGGTSCAAPLWAGFIALVNQQAVAAGKPTVGFINPAVYALGQGGNYASAFHDITTGNNTRSGSPSRFYAVPGYDLCTGWGTPTGSALINALATPDPLQITPATGFASVGVAGGPFSVTSRNYTLTNVGTATLDWTVNNTAAWLDVAPVGGSLVSGGPATTLSVKLNAAASNLVAGIYDATVWFTNLTDGVGQGLGFNLAVLIPPAITNQPADQAVLGGGTATFEVGADGSSPLFYQWRANGANLADGGHISGATNSILSVANVAAGDLGSYSVVVSNAVGVTTSMVAQLTMTPSAPVIVTQPVDQTVIRGTTAAFSVGVQGSPPFSYQWSFNGTNLNGETDALLIIPDAQLTNAGTYAVLVSNGLGNTPSSNAVLIVKLPCVAAPAGLVGWWPAENNANDIVGGDDGALMNGAGFAAGEVGRAFAFSGAGQFVQVSNTPALNPTNGMTLETWVYVSGYPAAEAVVAEKSCPACQPEYLLSLTNVGSQWAFAAAASPTGGYAEVAGATSVQLATWYHLAMTYDGSVLKVYVDGVLDGSAAANGPLVPDTGPFVMGGQASGADGLNGLVDEVSAYNRALTPAEIQSVYNGSSGGKCPGPPFLLDMDFGAGLAQSAKTGFAAIGQTGNDFWNWYSRDDGQGGWRTFGAATNLALADGTVTEIGMTVANAPGAYPNGSTDPMYNDYIYPFDGGEVTITVTNLPAGQYDVLPYANDGNFALTVEGTSYGTRQSLDPSIANPPVWTEGVQYAHFTNVLVNAGQALLLTVRPGVYGYAIISGMQIVQSSTGHGFSPPVLVTQPANQRVPQGGTASFSVGASGTAPLSYQWSLNGTNLGGASASSLTVTNVQMAQAGSYAVLVSNPYGSVLSSNAVLTVSPPSTNGFLVDMDFGAGLAQSAKSGFAAIGQTGNDFWNWYSRDDGQGGWRTFGAATNLALADGTVTEIGMTVANAPGAYPNGSTDPMYNDYIYPFDGGNVTITVTNLPAGTYDVLPYANDGNFEVSVGGLSYGIRQCLDVPQVNPPVWTEGKQYARFTNVMVNARQSLVLTVRPGAYGYAIICGMQLVQSGVAPSITTQPASQTVPQAGTANFSVGAGGTPPLSYQWTFNGTNLGGASGSSLTLTNVQVAEAGSYAVFISNRFGSVLSSNALLTVGVPPAITAQPIGQSVSVGSNATFAVQASGSPLLGYQWSFNGLPLPGATKSSLTVTNVQAPQAGTYVVLVSNSFGSVLSTDAVLTVNPPPGIGFLVDMDFGAGLAKSAKKGFAAIGQTSNDFWNWYSRDDGHGGYLSFGAVTNLEMADTTHTQVGMTIANAPGAYPNGSTDPMYDDYIYPFNGGNVTITVTNLPAGQYNVLPYGNDGNFEVTVGGLSYGIKHSLDVPLVNPPVWSEGVQYARFTNVSVSAGQSMVLTVRPGSYGYAVISGVQFAKVLVDHPPVAANFAAATGQNQSLGISAAKVLLYASDPDGDPLMLSVGNPSTNGGSVTLSGGMVTYTPVSGFVGVDRFTYTVSDGRGGSASAYVLVQVRPGNGTSGNMLPLVPIAAGYRVSFAGLPGYTYTVQRAASPTGPWTTLGSVATGPDGIGVYLDTNAPPVGAFYRTRYP